MLREHNANIEHAQFAMQFVLPVEIRLDVDCIKSCPDWVSMIIIAIAHSFEPSTYITGCIEPQLNVIEKMRVLQIPIFRYFVDTSKKKNRGLRLD